MSSKDTHLYGIQRPKKLAGREIASSSSLSFNTALSSLIASATSSSASTSSNRVSSGRPRSKNDKDDIFTTQNHNPKKRIAADMLAQERQAIQATTRMDETSWKRTKRKMEEKARLYAAMKRGDVEDLDEKHMVDFDRKWAEKQKGEDSEQDDDDEDMSEDEGERVQYTDEFGRSRTGTRAEALREERRKQGLVQAKEEQDRFTARPKQPSNIILGDTIQTAAFNPDEPIAAQMAELAAKRDREPTPPDMAHYDANWEIRSKGTGFFQFSTDEEERQRQMQSLEDERKETERKRAEGDKEVRKEERKKEVEARRKLVQEKRGRVQADKFLETLGEEIGGPLAGHER